MYSVTKRIDFCYGHRLLDYDGICKHPHGHNAVAEIEVRTDAGRLLGAVSPHAVPKGREAGTYLVPVPGEVFTKGRLSIRLSRGSDRRAPGRDEVKSVRVRIRDQ